MYGCGLVLFNPPWTLRAGLEETLPFLADCLGKGSWNLT
jgi:23S rRNA (adenine2030-N6)-methyltransferase